MRDDFDPTDFGLEAVPRADRGNQQRRLPSAARVPPHALEAEMSVLGGLMLDNRRFDDVIDILVESDFYTEQHRLVFRAIRKQAGRAAPFDWVTVSEALRDDVEDDRKANPQGLDSLERVGGQGFVAQLTLDVPGASNVRAYAEIVQAKAMQRALIAVGLDTVALAQEPDGRKSAELIDAAEAMVFGLRRRAESQRVGPVPYTELIQRVHTSIERNSRTAGSAGLTTGIARFDEMTAGLHRSDLVIVAGRPSMGKSSLAGSIADHVAVVHGKRTAVFSMEMSAEQWAARSVANRCSVPLQHIRTGKLTHADHHQLTLHDAELRRMPIEVDESGALSPLELRAKARRIAARGDLGLVIVDYIQLMQIPGFRDGRTQEVSEISRSLKALAKELDVPVIALSQLNRGVENRDNKRPRMADLRESGAIEQDADVIVFIYRDEVYYKDSRDKGTAEIIIGKQRNGPTGTAKAAFVGQFCRFADLAPEWATDAGAGPQAPMPDPYEGFGGSYDRGLL